MERTFDIECEKPNGKTYMGDISMRHSFKTLMNVLEDLKGYKRKNGWVENY